jgi:hypothetical protein
MASSTCCSLLQFAAAGPAAALTCRIPGCCRINRGGCNQEVTSSLGQQSRRSVRLAHAASLVHPKRACCSAKPCPPTWGCGWQQCRIVAEESMSTVIMVFQTPPQDRWQTRYGSDLSLACLLVAAKPGGDQRLVLHSMNKHLTSMRWALLLIGCASS